MISGDCSIPGNGVAHSTGGVNVNGSCGGNCWPGSNAGGNCCPGSITGGNCCPGLSSGGNCCPGSTTGGNCCPGLTIGGKSGSVPVPPCGGENIGTSGGRNEKSGGLVLSAGGENDIGTIGDGGLKSPIQGGENDIGTNGGA